MRKLSFVIISIIYCLNFVYAQQQTVTLNSPDNQVLVKLFTQNKELYYSIYFSGENISTNKYGFQLGDRDYGTEIESIKIISKEKINRTFDVRGYHNTAHTIKNAYRLDIHSGNSDKDFSVVFNVYNNGIASSYEVEHHNQKLKKDLSNIYFPKNVTYWYQSDVVDYEGNYSASKADEIKDKQKIGMPLTITYPSGKYAAVMESNLIHFAGTHFVFDKPTGILNNELAGAITPVTPALLKSSWYIIAVSRNPNDLVNNDIVNDVADNPDKTLFPQGLHTEWIKPGLALWSWMSNDRSVNPENMKRFTDYASKMHIPYNLIDEGWSYWKADGKDCWDFLKDQVDYAKEKNVGIWVWKAYPDRSNIKGLIDSAYLREFMRKCAEVGVKGLKIDFFDSEEQREIDFYSRAAQLAAQYHLMIDYHGTNKATGLEYTYPNVLTQEGVRGLEQEFDVNWPFHNTVLPFTRYLSGPADFTPMSFRPFVYSTTLAHQAATVAMFTSPFLCLGVDPADLLKSKALPFIENMPSTWDETIVLKESQLGKVVVFARKKGDDWYIAITNGELPTRLNIDLSFLSKNEKYKLKEIKDELGSRKSLFSDKANITSNSRLPIEMPFGGGYIGILVKQ